jgi:hypothetical protein
MSVDLWTALCWQFFDYNSDFGTTELVCAFACVLVYCPSQSVCNSQVKTCGVHIGILVRVWSSHRRLCAIVTWHGTEFKSIMEIFFWVVFEQICDLQVWNW